MITMNENVRRRDDLLDEVVTAYLEAVESGQPPDPNDWLARYPELAGELARFFADQDKVTRWTAPLRQTVSASRADATPSPALDPTVHVPECLHTQFGDYELLEEIARGGMGIVCKARQANLDRLVALKMIIAGHLASRADVRRFHAEALAAARLDHPHIVPIYEVGERQGQHYYSMKLMEGGSLADCLTEFAARPREAAALMAKVARAVHHAHQRGILHRDLKPGNVLLDAAGEPHVSDFGLAKRLEDLNQSGIVVGTPSYMAPEQASDPKNLTTAADIYSLGAILYALLTGDVPFRGNTREETLRLSAEQKPARPRALNPRVPRDLETICLKCLEKSPARRFASAAALAEDLERFLAGEPVQARLTPSWLRGLKWARRRPAPAALVVVSSLTLLSLLAGFFQYQQRRAEAAEQDLKERRHIDSLVLNGRHALSRAHYADARVHFASARQLLDSKDGLEDLKTCVAELLEETNRKLGEVESRQLAQSKYQRLMHLRDQAFLQETLFLGADVPADLRRMRAGVIQALSLFAVTPEAAGGPVFDKPFSASERHAVRRTCYELLIMLAEIEAQNDPPRLKEALQMLDRAAGLGRPTRTCYSRRAAYLERLGDKHSAAEARAQAAGLPPAGALDYFLMGEGHHRQGDLPRAISALNETLRLQPDHFWARYFLSVCHLRKQPPQPELAVASLTACLSQKQNVAWVYLLRGIAHGHLGQFQAAQEDFNQALAQEPSTEAQYAILVNRGALFGQRKKTLDAVADLRRAIGLKPGQYQAQANLAKIYQENGRPDLALEHMNAAVQAATALVQSGEIQRPSLAVLYRNRARLRRERREPNAALQDLGQAIRLSQRAEDHAESGRLLHRLQRYPEAMKAYEAALAAAPDLADAHLGRAEVLFKLESYDEAVRALDRYLHKPGQNAGARVLADAHRARGLTQVKLGHHADAVTDFTRALAVLEDSATYAYRGWAYLVNNAPGLAGPDFERALQLDPRNSDAYTGRATARLKGGLKDGDVQASVADADKALSLAPANDVRMRCNAARIYAQAAARLDAQQSAPAAAMRAQYRQRAERLLREALELMPARERRSFWHRHIQGDPDLARFADLPTG